MVAVAGYYPLCKPATSRRGSTLHKHIALGRGMSFAWGMHWGRRLVHTQYKRGYQMNLQDTGERVVSRCQCNWGNYNSLGPCEPKRLETEKGRQPNRNNQSVKAKDKGRRKSGRPCGSYPGVVSGVELITGFESGAKPEQPEKTPVGFTPKLNLKKRFSAE
ncbi:hypothetical protein KIL84_011803 [Mauremys mutica]|uniref:Uncharacterized protein n=1 Tax=Mauremys mutica TaxID=74926 RepID=A0A9D3XEB3_9SAUR|nr:hypothetical protein KIL84_011803 [Mauremys mutica]